MTDAQTSLYWREWGNVRTKLIAGGMSSNAAAAERSALHLKALNEYKSSKLFSNADFDKVLAVFRAISQPANARTQIALEAMPETRKRTYIRHLLAALDESETYADSIIQRMRQNRRLRSTGASNMLTLETLHMGELEKLKVALKIECRRRWPKKTNLLGEIHTIRTEANFPEAPTRAAVMLALNTTTLPWFDKLYYEPLLIVLATLRRLSNGTLLFPEVETLVEDPF